MFSSGFGKYNFITDFFKNHISNMGKNKISYPITTRETVRKFSYIHCEFIKLEKNEGTTSLISTSGPFDLHDHHVSKFRKKIRLVK